MTEPNDGERLTSRGAETAEHGRSRELQGSTSLPSARTEPEAITAWVLSDVRRLYQHEPGPDYGLREPWDGAMEEWALSFGTGDRRGRVELPIDRTSDERALAAKYLRYLATVLEADPRGDLEL